MEIFFLIALGYGAVWMGRKVLCRLRERRHAAEARRRWVADLQISFGRRQQEQQARNAVLRHKNRLMQTALLQLEQAPDFYRAASFAAHAADIPLAFRQQQFHRFRPSILAHAVAKLRNGFDGETLRDSLDKLVTNLGMASFEADYIWQEAQRQCERRESPRATYAEAMTTMQQEHEQRMSVLRTLVGVDDELREQLVEAEEQRFRDQMLTHNDQPVQHHEEF